MHTDASEAACVECGITNVDRQNSAEAIDLADYYISNFSLTLVRPNTIGKIHGSGE